MNAELLKHLDKTIDTVSEVDRVISEHQYPDDRRTLLVMGLLSTIIQHHRSILLLIKSTGTVGSSWALARDVVRGTRYGLWIDACATEEQIGRVEVEDDFPLSIPEMNKAIDAAYNPDLFFEGLKNRWAMQLYKYSRSDLIQLGRWNIDSRSGLHVDDQEIRDVTTIAALCIVLLAGKFLASHGHWADCERVQALAAEYAS
jgi:hypothetical protein